MLKVLELFCGNKSFSKVAEKKGCEIFTVDLLEEFQPDLTKNILDLKAKDIPFKPDIIWASPPCKTWSIASCSFHFKRVAILNENNEIIRMENRPKTPQALEGVEIVKRTLELIRELNPSYWFIENPRGLLRKHELMENLPIRNTVTYCQYGDTRMKPTDIWTNFDKWNPRKMCKNGEPCHESAPRGSRTGTQGRKWKDSILVPSELCEEIMEEILRNE